jgi:hypothetical protein
VIGRGGSRSRYSTKSENPKRNNWHSEAKTAAVMLPTNDRMVRQCLRYNTPYRPQQYRSELQKNTVSESCLVITAVLHSNLKRAFSSDMYEYMHISVGTATGYGLDGPVSIPGRGKVSLFSTASIPPLRPTQPPIQLIPGAISLGIMQLGREADHSPPFSAEVNITWSYTSSLRTSS